jgi:hypothetical protein
LKVSASPDFTSFEQVEQVEQSNIDAVFSLLVKTPQDWQ